RYLPEGPLTPALSPKGEGAHRAHWQGWNSSMTSHDPTYPPPRRLKPWNAVERGLAKVGITGRMLVLAAPLVWLFVFFLIPLFVVFGISLTTKQFGRPPYSPLLTSEEGMVQLTLHLNNYIRLFTDNLYVA